MTQTFKHRCVQDLAWVIASPPVISGDINNSRWLDANWCRQELADCLPALKALDTAPEPLLEALAQLKTRRLGERFECFVAFWLLISPNYDCLYQNTVISEPQRTLGELDFIIREKLTDKIIHLEVAVKFYLGKAGELHHISGWYGPGLQDKLDYKFNRLCTHQTQLSRKHPELMPVKIDETWCMVKGRMFYPAHNTETTPFLAPEHLQGMWYTAKDAPDSGQFVSLTKHEWLSEIQHPEIYEASPNAIESPRCFSEVMNGQETARFFILPNDFWSRA